MSFPLVRMRRNRRYGWLRDIVAETNLSVQDLILPMFVCAGENIKQPISSLPGIYQYSPDIIGKYAKEAADLGIPAIALFPIIDQSFKSEDGDEAYNPDSALCRAIRHIKQETSNLGIICDVALDPYTISGHDGIIVDGDVDNDSTIEALKKQALVLVKAGADIIAPSDMMDGRVMLIRESLEEENFKHISICSYSAKYASSFYGPFRDIVAPKAALGKDGKKSYQLDPRNISEALREIELDIEEGSDMILVKPGMMSLDVIYAASQTFPVPILAYQVSGEYAMIIAAAEKGYIDRKRALFESIMILKRAGARAIFTYGAIEIAKLIKEGYRL